MEENEPPNPVRIDLLGANAEMLKADDLADAIEQFGLADRERFIYG